MPTAEDIEQIRTDLASSGDTLIHDLRRLADSVELLPDGHRVRLNFASFLTAWAAHIRSVGNAVDSL